MSHTLRDRIKIFSSISLGFIKSSTAIHNIDFIFPQFETISLEIKLTYEVYIATCLF